MALHRAFGLFGQVRRNGSFPPETLNALRTIKYCALAIIGFVAGGLIFIIKNADGDDRPAGVFMSVLVVLAASIIALTAAKFARNLQSAWDRTEGRHV